MTKLNTLLPEQTAKLSAYRDHFLAAGLSTAPSDFDAAEAALRDAYKIAGLDPPTIMIRLRSPYEG